MNNLKSLTRVIALMLLVVMTMSMVSCDLNSLIESVMGRTHSFVDGECACGETDPDYTHEHTYANGKCIYCGEAKPDDGEQKPDDGEQKPDDGDKTEYKTITIAEALEIAAQNPGGTTELYYIHATVKSIVDAGYGEMYITDETGEIYVYGTRGEDGVTFFDQLLQITLGHYRVGDGKTSKLDLSGLGAEPEVDAHPVVQRSVVFKLQRAKRVRYPLQIVADGMRKVVHRVDAPLIARAVVRCA